MVVEQAQDVVIWSSSDSLTQVIF